MYRSQFEKMTLMTGFEVQGHISFNNQRICAFMRWQCGVDSYNVIVTKLMIFRKKASMKDQS